MPDAWTLDRALQFGLRLQDREPMTLTPVEVGELGEVLTFLAQRLTALEGTLQDTIETQRATIELQRGTIEDLQEMIHGLVSLTGSPHEEGEAYD